jgi:predicted anti-sigma-YlaC factor YlaD
MEELKKSGVTSLSQAYLSYKKDELKMNGFEMVSQSDPEEGLLPGDEFNDDEGGNNRSHQIVHKACWSTTIVLAAAASLGLNIMIMVTFQGVATIMAGTIASVVAIRVGVAAMQLEYLDSEYHHVQS